MLLTERELLSKVYDSQSGNYMGRIKEILLLIELDGSPVPSNPITAEFSMSPFNENEPDDFTYYWQE